jgi:hypothetical protein
MRHLLKKTFGSRLCESSSEELPVLLTGISCPWGLESLKMDLL